MKNTVFGLFTLIFVLSTDFVSSQEFQGKAFYQSNTHVEMDLSGSGMPAERIKMIQERMRKQLQKTYILDFNQNASIFKEDVQLDQASGNGRPGMRMVMIGGFSNGKLYKNTQSKQFAQEQELSGKNFLIKDAMKTYDWKMEDETKMIGNYLCFKATIVEERPKMNTSFSFGRRANRTADNSDSSESKDSENSDKEEIEEPEVEMEPVIITAWYTLDIPVNHGPADYWGLPGLILEIGDNRTQYLCTKVVMNSKDKVEISEPKKGKKVNQKEFEKIRDEKMKEMQENFQNNRRRGDGHMRSIRIGG
jgi:GLPGLI family protein